jgi:predicted DNA binding CopG/RHH family protein
MTKKTTTNPNRIPDFASREEEAEFWDTHSTADFEDEFRPVKVRFAKNLSEGITIRLDPETMTTLRTRAKDKGLGPTTLIRMWVLERLREEAASSHRHV